MKNKFNNLTVENITLEQVQKDCKKKGWLLSALGCVIYGVLKLFGCKPQDYHGIPYFAIGSVWGGVSFGWFFIMGKNNGTHTMNHEVGHIVQNAMVGGFPMLWYTICSAVRYWKRRIFGAKTDYDAWWFEGQASALGTEFINKIKGE